MVYAFVNVVLNIIIHRILFIYVALHLYMEHCIHKWNTPLIWRIMGGM